MYNRRHTCLSLSKELGLHENTIYKWIQQYKENQEQAFSGSENLKSDAEERRKHTVKSKN